MSEEETGDIEALARRQGWTPQDEFKGDPDKWVDAEQFVERGKQINPILRKNNEALEKKIEEMSKKLDLQAKAAEDFRKYHEGVAQREYQKALKDIQERKKEALANEDVVEYAKAEADEKDLTPPVKSEDAPTMDQPHPEFVSWVTENQWYVDNNEAHAIADALGPIVNQQTGLVGRALFDAVKEKVRLRMPELFEESESPKRQPRQAVETGGGVVKSGKKTYSDLPADAKAICDSFVAQGFLTREQYIKDFDWSSV